MALRISARLMRGEEHEKGQGQKEHLEGKVKDNGNSKASANRSYSVQLHPERAENLPGQFDGRLKGRCLISDEGKNGAQPTDFGEWPKLRAANKVQKGAVLTSLTGTTSKEGPGRNGVSPCSLVCMTSGQLEAETGRGKAEVRQNLQEGRRAEVRQNLQEGRRAEVRQNLQGGGRTCQREDCQTLHGETGKLKQHPAADLQIQQNDFQNGKLPAEAGIEGIFGKTLGEGEQAAHVSNLSAHVRTLPRVETEQQTETQKQQTEMQQQQTEKENAQQQTERKTGTETEDSAEQEELENFGEQSREEGELNFANTMGGRGKMKGTLKQKAPKDATGKANFGYSSSNKEGQEKDKKQDYGSWKEAVIGRNNRQGRILLNFYPPKMNGEEMVVIPPPEVEEAGSEIWKNCLVGYFVGKKLPFMFVQKLAWQKWRRMGLVKTLSNSNGFFIFVFNESANLDEVMQGGFAHFANHLLILKKWDKDMELDKEPPKNLHIWVHLSNVPLHLWHGEGFSYIASAIGKPLFLDEITEDCERLRFARVCVEVEPEKELPWEVKVLHGNGRVTMVRVAYPWKPLRCSECIIFGHSKQNCPKVLKAQAGGEPQRTTRVWKKVVSTNEEGLKHNREPVFKQKKEQNFQQEREVISAETVDEVERQHGNENQGNHEDNKGSKNKGVEVCRINREQDIEGILSSNAFESLGSVEAQDDSGSSQAIQPKKKKKEKKKKKTVLTEDEGEKGNEGKEGPSHCL